MRAYKALLSLLLVVSISTNVVAQRNYARKGENAYNNEQYIIAIDEYKKAYDKVPSIQNPKKRLEKAEYAYYIAMSYMHLTEVENAEQWFDKAVLLKYYEEEPKVYFWLSEVQREQGLYDKARDNLKEYKELYPGGERLELAMESLDKAAEFKAEKTKHVIENLERLNTDMYEFSPVIASRKGDEIIFTSSREGGPGTELDPRTGQNFMNLWISSIDKKGNFGEPVLVEGVNTSLNEGALCFDKRLKTMYFTRCPFEENTNLGCDIYMVEKRGASWGDPVKMKLKDTDSTSVGHPALNGEGNVLIFASDMAGGYGGKDLWISKYDRRADEWSIPENLGDKINTPGDEMFPTFGTGDQLYFASTGHPGIGGLDMFSTTKIEGEDRWVEPTNLGFPLNTERNDYGIIFEDEEMTKGYFSSNRNGSKGGNIDDIYRFHLPPVLFTVTSQITDQKTGEPVANAKINLIGSDGSNIEVITDENGQFTFDKKSNDDRYIKKKTTYEINVEKEGYFSNRDKVSTLNIETSYDFFKEILLEPVPDEEEALPMPEVRYDLGKSELQVNDSVNSKDSLNYLYNILVDNPKFIVKLRSHTDCRGSDAANMKLSIARAQSCVDYLVNEKGIDPDRLIAEGRGEEEPLVLTNVNEEGDTTRTELTCDYIAKQKTKAEQEELHQRNRRTDFQIIGFDFVPKEDNEEGKEEEENDEGTDEEE